MEELSRLEARMQNLGELRELFNAMEAMAASRVQAALAALTAIRQYTSIIEEAIGDAISIMDKAKSQRPIATKPQRGAVVAICSEHGFAGAFNRMILESAKSELRSGEEEALVLVGQRGATAAREIGMRPIAEIAMATRMEGILGTARQAAERLKEFESIRIVFGRHCGGTKFQVTLRQVLPPSPRIMVAPVDRPAPLFHLEPRLLLRRLLEEFVLAELMLSMTESFASENAARLQTMQSATHNIGNKLEILTGQTRRLRQEAITSELLEVVAGGEAVTEAS